MESNKYSASNSAESECPTDIDASTSRNAGFRAEGFLRLSLGDELNSCPFSVLGVLKV